MSSALQQSSSSPHNTKKSFTELLGLANPAFPNPIWGPILDTSQYGDDYLVPDTGTSLPFSDDNQLGMGFQLPMVQPESNYFSACGFDEPCNLTNVLENGLTTDVTLIPDHGTSSFPSSSLSNTNWSDGNQQAWARNVRVGSYSAEERRDRILRYLQKRNQRNFNKTIKYACRKRLADRRIRVRGRFAKNNEEPTGNGVQLHQGPSSYYDYADQVKQDGEEWLQEAISSFMFTYNYTPQCQQLTGLTLQ